MTLAAQVLIAMAGTLAFTIRFQVPAKHYFMCALVGGLGWLVFYSMRSAGSSLAFATFVSVFIILTLSRSFSAIFKTPTIVYLFAGIFPLVPGAGIYYTAYYIFLGDGAMAWQHCLQTLTVAGAITLGILFGYVVPQGWYNALGRGFRLKGNL